MRTDSHQCPPNQSALSTDLPWCDSQNHQKDKTSPLCPTVRVISSLTAVQNSGPQWRGGGKGGPASSSISTTAPWPPYAAVHKGVRPYPGGPVRCAAKKCPGPFLWGRRAPLPHSPSARETEWSFKDGYSPQLGGVFMTILFHSNWPHTVIGHAPAPTTPPASTPPQLRVSIGGAD